MHLYLLARAEKDRLQKWVNDLSAQFFPINVEIDKKIVEGKIQIAVRPIQIYEVVFPREYEAEVMGLIKPVGWFGGKFYHKIIKLFAKMFGLKKCLSEDKWIIPKDKYLYNEHVHVLALGIKEDIIKPVFERNAKIEEQL